MIPASVPQWLVDLGALAEFGVSLLVVTWLIDRWYTRRDRIVASKRARVQEEIIQIEAERERRSRQTFEAIARTRIGGSDVAL